MTRLSRSDRVLGMLLGHLVGDALGSGYEFGPAFREGDPDPVMRRGVFGHPTGTGTDDTEVMRACARTVLESCADGIGFAPSLYAEKLGEWKDTGPRDIGGQTARAIRYWRATGKPPRRDETAQGNGALMGCAPLAVLSHPDAAADKAIALSLATHPSEASIDACAAYVRKLWYVLNDQVDPGPVSPWDVTAPRKVQNWVPDGVSIGWVLGSLRLALGAYEQARVTGDPTRALLDVVRMGGDTDTNAAIAGALIGADHGPDAFADIAGDLLPPERIINEGLALQLAAL